MANLVYNRFKEGLMNADEDLEGGTFKVLLLTDGYTPDADDTNVAALTLASYEASGTGYDAFNYASTTPKELTGLTTTTDTGNDLAYWDANDVTWSSSTVTARYAVIYRHVDGVQANDLLCVLIDFGSNKSSSAGDFTIQWNSDGIISLA